MKRPFRETQKGLEVFLRVTPKASANRMQGLIDDGSGLVRLKIQVTTVPENGKANAAVIKLLSKVWKIPKTDFMIVAGQTERNKTLLITGNACLLAATVLAALKIPG